MTIQEDRRDREDSPKIPPKLPMEYWETEDSSRGGLIGNLSQEGVVIYSTENIPTGTESRLRIFFRNGNDFNLFRVIGRIIWKYPDCQDGWDGFAYGIEFVSSFPKERTQLEAHLHNNVLKKGFRTF